MGTFLIILHVYFPTYMLPWLSVIYLGFNNYVVPYMVSSESESTDVGTWLLEQNLLHVSNNNLPCRRKRLDTYKVKFIWKMATHLCFVFLISTHLQDTTTYFEWKVSYTWELTSSTHIFIKIFESLCFFVFIFMYLEQLFCLHFFESVSLVC